MFWKTTSAEGAGRRDSTKGFAAQQGIMDISSYTRRVQDGASFKSTVRKMFTEKGLKFEGK